VGTVSPGNLAGGSIALAGGVLTSLGWTASSTAVGATGVSYTFTFTTASTALVSSFTMTVPPGTGGTPTLGTVVPLFLGSVILSGTTLTVSGLSLTLLAGTPVSIQVNGRPTRPRGAATPPRS
jgi:hypothetical protein